MAKTKTAKGSKGVPNKHLYSRISYLYQAATYLSLQQNTETVRRESKDPTGHKDAGTLENTATCSKPTRLVPSGLALQLSSHLRGVSLKSQVRLSHNLKRSICKCCNAVLIPGCTSTTGIENQSRGGKKPWADVLVIECNTCGSKKRFPVGSERQTRKTARSKTKEGSPAKSAS
ncbi:Rpr2-domain-containing protein [Glonium stellatum]|uniref:Rpr2-domain-containing protein n=1 Tax=Glonium stellatum TaxID=574774 RepID=A0A8E2EUK6_9PEZI|nr:Rpr2-domain-containing protein [Glonium stellatum]